MKKRLTNFFSSLMMATDNEKCRFHKTCKLYQPDGFTCQHEGEAASGYCGYYKILEGRK